MSFYADDGVQYIEDHLKEVCQAVDDKIEESSDEIEKQIFDYIREHVNADTKHLEWDFDGCPYDHSGILVEKGTIDLSQSLGVFLNEEYTGQRIPTFESGCGWHYECFGEPLATFSWDIAEAILKKVINTMIENHFHINMENEMAKDKELFADILDEVHDLVFDDSLVSSFFFPGFAVEWLGIEDITIQEILNMEGLPNVCD